jgi:hypothetical protein
VWTGKWVFVELYYDAMARSADGSYMSIWELTQAVRHGDSCELTRLDRTPETDERTVREEYEHRARIPLVYDPPLWSYPLREYRALVDSYPVFNGWTYMPLEDWLAKYYAPSPQYPNLDGCDLHPPVSLAPARGEP